MNNSSYKLLAKDLAGRIPYGVKCQINIGDGDYYVDYSSEIEYSYKELRDKKLTKVDVSENELIEWHDELAEKMRVITFNMEKERKNLVNLYLEKIIKL